MSLLAGVATYYFLHFKTSFFSVALGRSLAGLKAHSSLRGGIPSATLEALGIRSGDDEAKADDVDERGADANSLECIVPPPALDAATAGFGIIVRRMYDAYDAKGAVGAELRGLKYWSKTGKVKRWQTKLGGVGTADHAVYMASGGQDKGTTAVSSARSFLPTYAELMVELLSPRGVRNGGTQWGRVCVCVSVCKCV